MAKRDEGDHVIVQITDNLQGASQGTSSLPPVAEVGSQGGHTAVVLVDDVNGGSPAADASAAVVDCLEDLMSVKLEGLPPSGGTPSNSPSDRASIWRVPPSIREHENEAYEPKLVSIGPFHRGKENLQPMEKVKLSFLRDLLNRSQDNQLRNYVRAIRECEHTARMQYGEEIKVTKEEFVEMLVVDGCFIIEYFLKRIFRQTAQMGAFLTVKSGLFHIRRDLMLLENQIPFVVLEKLFEHSTVPFVGARVEPLGLLEITLPFLGIQPPVEELPLVHHLLHLYHLCLDPRRVKEIPSRSSSKQMVSYPLKKARDLILLLILGLAHLVCFCRLPRCFSPSKKRRVPRNIACATDLSRSGIRFRKKNLDRRSAHCFLKLSFTEAKLEIPFLAVDGSTSYKLRNLIALEECCPHLGVRYLTSYGIFMQSIINSESDVAILRRHGIIESNLPSNADVAAVFNGLCNGTSINYNDHYFAPLFRYVDGRSNFVLHRWLSSLRQNRPLFTIAGIALLLTAVQAYFTIFPRK